MKKLLSLLGLFIFLGFGFCSSQEDETERLFLEKVKGQTIYTDTGGTTPAGTFSIDGEDFTFVNDARSVWEIDDVLSDNRATYEFIFDIMLFTINQKTVTISKTGSADTIYYFK